MTHFTNSRHHSKPLPSIDYTAEPSSTDNLIYTEGSSSHPYQNSNTPSPSNGLIRRKSILKIPKMDITWDEPSLNHSHQPPRPITPNSTNPKKLQKQPKKGVRFAPSTQGEGEYHPTGLPTPEPTPEKVNVKPTKPLKIKPSWIHWPFGSSNHSSTGGNQNHSAEYRLPTLNDTPSPTGSDTSWHHHSSYFPEYTPIYPTPPKVISPSLYHLNAAELQAQEHSSRVGHSVQVHYPILPSWSEYGGQQDKSKNGWQSATSHALTSGWNGFGWNEDKLPKSNELTFGKPAPVGEPLEGAKKKKKKKKKKGGAGGGGAEGGGEGDDDDEGGEGEGGDEEGG